MESGSVVSNSQDTTKVLSCPRPLIPWQVPDASVPGTFACFGDGHPSRQHRTQQGSTATRPGQPPGAGEEPGPGVSVPTALGLPPPQICQLNPQLHLLTGLPAQRWGGGTAGGTGEQGGRETQRNLPPSSRPARSSPCGAPSPSRGLPLPQPHSGAQIKEKPEQRMFVVPPPIKDSVATVTGTLHQLGSRWSVSNRQHLVRKR